MPPPRPKRKPGVQPKTSGDHFALLDTGRARQAWRVAGSMQDRRREGRGMRPSRVAIPTHAARTQPDPCRDVARGLQAQDLTAGAACSSLEAPIRPMDHSRLVS